MEFFFDSLDEDEEAAGMAVEAVGTLGGLGAGGLMGFFPFLSGDEAIGPEGLEVKGGEGRCSPLGRGGGGVARP